MCNFVWLSQKITLFGLQPFEEYEVAVLAFNSVGEGPAVKKLIRTAEGSKIFIHSTHIQITSRKYKTWLCDVNFNHTCIIVDRRPVEKYIS